LNTYSQPKRIPQQSWTAAVGLPVSSSRFLIISLGSFDYTSSGTFATAPLPETASTQ